MESGPHINTPSEGMMASWTVQMRDHHGLPYIEKCPKASRAASPSSESWNRIGRLVIGTVATAATLFRKLKTASASRIGTWMLSPESSPIHVTHLVHCL